VTPSQCNTTSFFYKKPKGDAEDEPLPEDPKDDPEEPVADEDEGDEEVVEDDGLWDAPEANFGPQNYIETTYEWYKQDVGTTDLLSSLLERRTPACNIYSALAPAFMARQEANRQNEGAFGQFKARDSEGKVVWKDIELQRISYEVDPCGGPTPAKARGGRGRAGDKKGKEPAEQAEPDTLPSNKDMLWMLPGSPHLLRHEHCMNINEHSNISVPYFAAFRRLVHLISEKEEDKGAEPFEFVIVDFGPSCTLLNKTFIMSCDYILPPVFCESFSFESVHGFLNELLPDKRDESGVIVPGWLTWARGRRNLTAPDTSEQHRFNPAAPRILPFLITAFKVRGQNSKGVKGMALQKEYARWAAAITNYVGQTPPGPVRDCFILQNTSSTNTEMTSCFLANLNSTMPVSHGIRIPLVYLNRAAFKEYAKRSTDKKGNSNENNLVKSVADAKAQYVNLAKFIIVRSRPQGAVVAPAGDDGAGPAPRAPPPAPPQRATRRNAAAEVGANPAEGGGNKRSKR